MKPFEIVSDEGLEIIEHNAETILNEVGVEIRDYPSALKVFADAVPTSTAPASTSRVEVPADRAGHGAARVHPKDRNPPRNVQDRRERDGFAPNYGSPFAFDLDNGRRYATIEDFRNFVKLTYQSLYLHHKWWNRVRTRRHPGQQATPRHGSMPTCDSATSRSWARSPQQQAQDSVDHGQDRLRRRPRRSHRP